MAAESVIAARTLRAQHLISPEDLALSKETIPGAETDPQKIIGRETAKTIYATRPVRLSDTVPPAVVGRNQRVMLVFQNGSMRIEVEGRALARGSAGDRIEVMNLSSRATVSGVVKPDATIWIEP